MIAYNLRLQGDLKAALEKAAREQHRSLNQQIVSMLEAALILGVRPEPPSTPPAK